MFWPTITELSLLTRQILMKLFETWLGSVQNQSVSRQERSDANGKWNYEVVVRTNGKESGFEVDPNGKLLRQHAEVKR